MESPILIPNPLYDVVFRYLMDDQRVAKLVLTAILGEKVSELEFQSTEQSLKLAQAQITVTRMDFRARIEQPGGVGKVVLIELQKAKLYQQIGRFRRYLGQQYQRNPQAEPVAAGRPSPLPIYPIYILGEPYSENGIPVVRVRRASYDASTGEKIEERHPFIEALTHDAIIIQTRYITGKRRTELERFLSIFDQSYISDEKGHKLSLVEETFPDAYRLVVRRLQQALADPELEAEMDLEDEVLVEFQKKDQEILAIRELAEQERREKEQERQEKEQERQEKEDTQRRFVRLLAEQGNDVEAITRATGLEAAVVQRLLAD